MGRQSHLQGQLLLLLPVHYPMVAKELGQLCQTFCAVELPNARSVALGAGWEGRRCFILRYIQQCHKFLLWENVMGRTTNQLSNHDETVLNW